MLSYGYIYIYICIKKIFYAFFNHFKVFKIPLAAYVKEKKPSEIPKSTLVLGKRFKHGKDNDVFCKPSDVAVLSSGEFFVSDGYVFLYFKYIMFY